MVRLDSNSEDLIREVSKKTRWKTVNGFDVSNGYVAPDAGVGFAISLPVSVTNIYKWLNEHFGVESEYRYMLLGDLNTGSPNIFIVLKEAFPPIHNWTTPVEVRLADLKLLLDQLKEETPGLNVAERGMLHFGMLRH